MGIPEEDHVIEPSYDFALGGGSRRSSMISLKRENSRRRSQSCSGCPGCEPQDLRSFCGKLPDFPNMAACQSCASSNVSESKQQSIRKWLEDVPILKPNVDNDDNDSSGVLKQLHSLPLIEEPKSPKRLRSPTRSLYSTRSLGEEPISKSPNYSRKANSLYGSTRAIMSSCRNKSPSKLRNGKSKAPLPPSKHQNSKIPGLKKSEDKIKPTLSNHYDVIRNIQPSSPKKMPHESPRKSLPAPDMINEAIEVDKGEDIPTITKEMMAAVINEFSMQRGIENESTNIEAKVEYEADSLEKNMKNRNGYSTPTEYAEIASQPSPSLSNALPMDEELTMRNEIFNKNTGNKTISKIPQQNEEEHDYELIVLTKTCPKEKKLYNLPELLQRSNGYSLVSEVYVNNGYNYGSAPSSRSGSNCSTLEKPKPKIRYDQPEEKPGHLTIEVEDCPDNYIRVEDSDNFEPDTLDRKPPKLKFCPSIDDTTSEYIDSLERPAKIMLRTTGSFKSGTINCLPNYQAILNANLHKSFGSLREIYEAKTKTLRPSLDSVNFEDEISPHVKKQFSWKDKFSDSDRDSDAGRLLTLEERQKKRQRKSSVGTVKPIPPDVIPPSIDSPIYEHPKPPRKVNQEDFKPPLPPKSGSSRGSTPKSSSPTHKDSSSPLSSISLDLPPSSCASINSRSSSDFEHYQQKFDENDLNEMKSDSILKKLMHSDDIVFKNGINTQFILQSATVTTNSPFKNFILSPKSSFAQKKNYGDTLLKDKSKDIKKTWRKLTDMSTNQYQQKVEDSGYLSTDSNESRRRKEDKESETDESLGDGHSESGAESVETHSVFFDCYRKFSNIGSMDSGVSQLLEEAASDQDGTISSRSSKIKTQR